MDENKMKDAYRVGLTVLILLAMLTLGEFWLGLVAPVWWAPLMGIGIIKAFYIVRDYMHIGRLFAAEEETH